MGGIEALAQTAGQEALGAVNAGTGLAAIGSSIAKAFADYETKKTENEMDSMNNTVKISAKVSEGMTF